MKKIELPKTPGQDERFVKYGRDVILFSKNRHSNKSSYRKFDRYGIIDQCEGAQLTDSAPHIVILKLLKHYLLLLSDMGLMKVTCTNYVYLMFWEMIGQALKCKILHLMLVVNIMIVPFS